MRNFLIVFFTLISTLIKAQQLNSPNEFLGYNLGTKFTPHYKVLSYFKHLQNTGNTKIVIEEYGKTNEGRELLLAFISSENNIKNLAKIKEDHINNIEGKSLVKGLPSIVWLSYNVHGDEPASTEAAIKTAYELVNSNQENITNWLKNTIVIIDPCLNPDGRDRYVNWYNSVVGKNSNADAQSREHFEPYPQGRTNHYYFDLNRDWAWQTQIETQQRLKKYLAWMPHIHVDFHEQGYNDPYYFAPAAEPMHNVITPWQKDVQYVIGKNHSIYFDKQGWLYFTKQIFDLFYPSYGDTYPSFNGSIGMTYEQGGKSAGLAVKTNANEVLTLTERIEHHFTTSISTIEAASKNSVKLNEEFITYFNKARNNNSAEYLSYIVSSNNENKIKAIKNFLNANSIEFSLIDSVFSKNAYSYQTLKDEKIVLKKYSLAVNVQQTHGTMATVLFEPKSKLSDTATYDITAWSLPYVFGVDGFALKTNQNRKVNNATNNSIIKVETNAYGVVVPYNSFSSSKFLTYLLNNNIKVRVLSKVTTINNVEFEAGSFVVLRNGNLNNNWVDFVNNAAVQFNIQPIQVGSGLVQKGSDFGSADVKIISQLKVALLSGNQVNANAMGEVWCFFDNELNYPVTVLNAEKFSTLNLNKYDVLIMPDGSYSFLNDKNNIIKLKEFMNNGGRVVALQEAVNSLAQTKEFGIKNKEDESSVDSGYSLLKKYRNRERDYLPNNIPGAIYKIELDNSHPLAYGYDNFYYTLKLDANIYEFLQNGWNVGYLKESNYVAGFRGYKVGQKLKDGTLFGSTEIGNGNLIFLAENPLFRLFWEDGKQLFTNAVFMPF